MTPASLNQSEDGVVESAARNGKESAQAYIDATIDYHLTVGHSQLEELCEVLSIKAKGYDETLMDAINRAIEEDNASARAALKATQP